MIEVTNTNPNFNSVSFKNYIDNYKIKDFPPGGGDCLFSSIAGVLNNKYPSLKITSSDVREKITGKLADISLWKMTQIRGIKMYTLKYLVIKKDLQFLIKEHIHYPNIFKECHGRLHGEQI